MISTIESLRQAVNSSRKQEQERLEEVKSIRKNAEDILRNGSRRLRPLFFLSLPIGPLMVVIELMAWPLIRENPIDLNTNITFKGRVEDTDIVVHSFDGDIKQSSITVDVKDLGRLRLGIQDALSAGMSPHDPIHNVNWWNRPMERSYREATLEELKAFSGIVQKLNPNPKYN